MKTTVYSVKGEKKGEIDVGSLFTTEVREDLIQRACVAEQSHTRQAYGPNPLAGKRTSAHYHGRRGIKHSMMNREMARIPRIHGQGHLNFTARFVPQATGGRKAHPPEPGRNWGLKINKKEWKKALLSAVSASGDKELVAKRGHLTDQALFIVKGIEGMEKTKDVKELLIKLGLEKELKRVAEKKIRAGKGTMRGRKYQKKKGPLIITVKEQKARIPGVDVVSVHQMQVSDVAPGALPGRLCVWSEDAISALVKG